MPLSDHPGGARERSLRSFPARLFYQPGPQIPPHVAGVADAVDIHVHAHEGQQDALAVAKLASVSGMGGLLFKTIVGRPGPAEAVRELTAALSEWCAREGARPVVCRAGGILDIIDASAPGKVAALLDSGVAAIWLPVITHANTLATVGGLKQWWDAAARPEAWLGPLPWSQALKLGTYLLDGNGRLKPELRDIIAMVAGRGAALFFGHATHAEMFALADEVSRLGFRRAVIDHPFSPFVDLDVAQMKRLAASGITLNFTYDELSPALGIDPARMYDAIREIGPARCALSSDAGDALFPNSVECMRLIRAYMAAYGLSDVELELVCVTNPAAVMGIEAAVARASAAE